MATKMTTRTMRCSNTRRERTRTLCKPRVQREACLLRMSDSDSDEDEQRLSNSFLQALVHYGTFYNPANTHYGNEGGVSYVACDHCLRQGIKECLALPSSDMDLCLACAVKFVVDFYCKGFTVADALLAVQQRTQFAVCNNDPLKASDWTAILLHTNSAGRVCGGHSGFLAAQGVPAVLAAAAAAGPAPNENGDAASEESFMLDRVRPPGGSDADDEEDSGVGADDERSVIPFSDANMGAGFATIVTANMTAPYDSDMEE
jgi:hypothetical protein